jgi:hypothetical protein
VRTLPDGEGAAVEERIPDHADELAIPLDLPEVRAQGRVQRRLPQQDVPDPRGHDQVADAFARELAIRADEVLREVVVSRQLVRIRAERREHLGQQPAGRGLPDLLVEEQRRAQGRHARCQDHERGQRGGYGSPGPARQAAVQLRDRERREQREDRKDHDEVPREAQREAGIEGEERERRSGEHERTIGSPTERPEHAAERERRDEHAR